MSDVNMLDELTISDDHEQHEPPDEVFAGIEEIDVEEALGLLDALDDLDLNVAGIAPIQGTMLQLAMAQYRQGVAEQPLGSNRGVPLIRYVRWFAPHSGPVPWCAYFVSWCLDRTSDSNRRVPWTHPGVVLSARSWARANGRLISTPRPGDLFGVGDHHMGIVAGVSGSTISTVEGNCKNRVAAIKRPKSSLWFARL